MKKKRVLVLTGGGDCPGLNAVIRSIVRRAEKTDDWEVIGSIRSFDGVLNEPMEIKVLSSEEVAGIHFRGGTILKTTTKGGPFAWPIKNPDGTWGAADRSEELLRRLQYLGVEAVINIGGDGSQKISQRLYEMGLKIIGVPKTIDNDLSATDFTFGFQTAVQIATESVDKLVTTAASHSRIMIMEVMGRSAGWIALHSAIGGGADVCIIPEIPYDPQKILKSLKNRFRDGKEFAIVVIAEGAKSIHGSMVAKESKEVGNQNIRLGGVANQLERELQELDIGHDTRVTILGHLQRGGVPIAYDRVLASQFGVKAFEMILEEKFGQMVAYRHPDIIGVPFTDAISNYNYVDKNSDIIKTARGLGISLGDE
jgi:6-phosphofructokinase 1